MLHTYNFSILPEVRRKLLLRFHYPLHHPRNTSTLLFSRVNVHLSGRCLFTPRICRRWLLNLKSQVLLTDFPSLNNMALFSLRRCVTPLSTGWARFIGSTGRGMFTAFIRWCILATIDAQLLTLTHVLCCKRVKLQINKWKLYIIYILTH